MQHSPDLLKARLLSCIDDECNVTDMAGCLSVITILEHTPITRKILEDTRLGKYVNDIRRKTKDVELPKRLKNLVRKWRDACQAEGVNGLSSRGPGPGGGGGGSSSNGRQSISPPFSAPNSVKGHGGGLSPCSLPSSGNTSPMGRISAPTTPSTLAYKSRTVSPVLTVAKGPFSVAALQAKKRTISPGLTLRSPALSPQSLTGSLKPQSPSLSKSGLSSNSRPTQENKPEATYLPSVDNVPKTNAANKRLRKGNEDSDGDLPPSKRSKNNLSNGVDDCSRDSFCSVISNDRISRASGEVGGGTSSIMAGPENCQQKPIRRSGRKRKNALDSHSGSNSLAELDPLRQKMAVIGATKCLKKVKTTSQLVAELAQRKGDALLARRASRLEERVKDKDSERSPYSRSDEDSVSQNKKEHMEKFLKSQPGPPLEEDDDEITILDDDGDTEQTSTVPPSPSNPTPLPGLFPFVPPTHPNSPPSNVDLLGISANETAEEILSRLPPLDLNAVDWDTSPIKGLKDPEIMSSSDSDDDEETSSRLTKKSKQIDASVVQTLHSTNVDCQNGNFDMDGRFREWHEVILLKAYQDSPLVVLPYVIADF